MFDLVSCHKYKLGLCLVGDALYKKIKKKKKKIEGWLRDVSVGIRATLLRDIMRQPSRQELDYSSQQVMAGRRNNNNGEMGGQNNQFLEGLTALLHEQNRIHGEQIQQILQAREQGSTPRRSAPSTQPVYKQFRELGPTEFKGTTDPIAAEGWIRSLETIFDFMQLTDADRIRCAIFMLRDDARVWWEGARLTVDLATLTWTDFKEVFYGKYFTVDNRTRLAREFLELRQGDLSVAEYVRRFERGRYFVPMITS
ncbi:uncharacterized protein LOC122025100 isoform X1 [Zingiber officinale]|uniref:uncharacterized protein LOC122025100 isoform X1 n=1 Tax=Zingiber officinale TaxID=94328 RepID=UPI001C4B6118|nr:uncharacterized protein LOC122025100 isoform X1 [Zingiber officinale]